MTTLCEPPTLGVHPRINCAARSPLTTTNSNAPDPLGRCITQPSIAMCFGEGWSQKGRRAHESLKLQYTSIGEHILAPAAVAPAQSNSAISRSGRAPLVERRTGESVQNNTDEIECPLL